MTNFPPCPWSDCSANEPHPHPLLGDGLYGPNPTAAERGSPDPARVEYRTMELQARCPRCPKLFQATVVVLVGRAPPAELITRTCDECLDAAERVCIERTPKPRAPVTYRDVVSAKRADDL